MIGDDIMKKSVFILLSMVLIIFTAACGDAEEEAPVRPEREIVELTDEELEELEALRGYAERDWDDEGIRYADPLVRLKEAKGIIRDNRGSHNMDCGIVSDGSLAIQTHQVVPAILREVNRFLGFNDDLIREFQRTCVYDGARRVSTRDLTVEWWTIAKDGEVTFFFLYGTHGKSR